MDAEYRSRDTRFMPKKRLSKTLQTKPSSTAPATLTASTSAPSSHGRSAAAPAPGSKQAHSSVNELISHLRQTQVSDEKLHRLPHAPDAATVHPSLRSTLGVPDTPPPRPRTGNNATRVFGPTRSRRIPGPPPPASWLLASRHADKSQDSTTLTSRRVEQSSNLPGGRFPREGSLQHTVLKAVATNLHWLLEYNGLHMLPTQLKQGILSYVAVYNEEPEHSQDKPVNAFRLLFPKFSLHSDDAVVDASIDDNFEVSRLDLSGAIGRWLSMKELKELLYMPHVEVARKDPDALPESWDDESEPHGETLGVTGGAKAGGDAAEAEPTSGAASGPPKSLEVVSLRFSNLTHLSLALSPAATTRVKRTAGSWSHLLKVAPSLSRLSSLSLAHWPSPTLTPHAASTYMTIKNPISSSLPGIPYGGSDMYTSYDGDWTEAANLLKILSRHLYCLQWLDLTGCGEWFAALSAANGAEWNGAWRSIECVGLCVGWSPEPVKDAWEPHSNRNQTTAPSPRPDKAGVHPFDNIRASQETHDDAQEWDEHAGNAQKKYHYKKAVEKYNEILIIARDVARSIHLTRMGQGKWIEFYLSPELPAMKGDWLQ